MPHRCRSAALAAHPGYARLDEHLPAALAVLVADVARRRAAAAAVEPHQLHAELVEIAVAGGVGLLDLDPQLVEGHGLPHERALHLDMAARIEVVDQLDAPFRPVIRQMHLEGARAE